MCYDQTFAERLRAAKGDLSAREVAARLSPLLSVRIVEHWLADYRTPPKWTHEWILGCARKPKPTRKAKGQNESDEGSAPSKPNAET